MPNPFSFDVEVKTLKPNDYCYYSGRLHCFVHVNGFDNSHETRKKRW